MILVGIGSIVTCVASMAGLTWWAASRSDIDFARMNEGKAFGTGRRDSDCAAEYERQLSKCHGEFDLACTSSAGMFAAGCLAACAHDDESACAGLALEPDETRRIDITKTYCARPNGAVECVEYEFIHSVECRG